MNGNCHFVFGASTSTALALNIDKIENIIQTYLPVMSIEINETTITLFVLGGLLGSVFPDIDNPKSHFGQLTRPLSTLIGKMQEPFGKTGARHRGIFHDFTMYVIGFVLTLFFFPPLIGFFVGCLSHLFLDCFNPMGVPCLLTKRGIHLGKIYAESKTAVVFSYTLSAIFFATGFIFYIWV